MRSSAITRLTWMVSRPSRSQLQVHVWTPDDGMPQERAERPSASYWPSPRSSGPRPSGLLSAAK